MRTALATWVLASVFLAGGAIAEETRQAPAHRLTWSYPRFSALEYVAASAASASDLALTFGTDRIPRGSWKNGVLFDDAVRSALRATTADGRDRAGRVSDVLWGGAMLYPIVVDSLLVPLALDRGNTDVAYQMLLLDWQAEGLAGAVTMATHRVVGRARPLLQGCSGPSCEPPNSGNDASFLSGHTSMAFAGAGLVCAHHQGLALYGGPVPDGLACGTMLGVATTTGVLRIVADKHWSTDVLAGAALGLGTGCLMPYAFHYAHFHAGARGPDVAIVPSGSPDGVVLSLVGVQ